MAKPIGDTFEAIGAIAAWIAMSLSPIIEPKDLDHAIGGEDDPSDETMVRSVFDWLWTKRQE